MSMRDEAVQPKSGAIDGQDAIVALEAACDHDFRREPYDFTKDGYFADDYDPSKEWNKYVCSKCGHSKTYQEDR